MTHARDWRLSIEREQKELVRTERRILALQQKVLRQQDLIKKLQEQSKGEKR